MSSVSIPGVEFPPGTLLAGRLKVLRRLGAGGVGAVYEIEHQVTRHRRALKILHPRFRAMPEVVERFLREGSAAGRIGNPHIVETFDAGELDNGAPWLLMELLAGEPLSEVLRRAGRLEFGPACGLIAEVALAVQAAHDAGIVHRDLKPDNLYVVERDGRPFVKVLDFGMSKFDSGVTGAVSMTAEGTTLGTPLYMAPEQMRGAKDVDGRADVYALGVILYEALAGGVPYNAASFAELAVLVLGGGCVRLETLRPDSPAGLADLVHRAMAIEPGRRFASARELAAALGPYAQIPPASSGWWRGDAEVGGLDRTAMRPTPMTPDPTFPSTPSPMPVSPRRVTAAAAQVSARSSAPFAPPLLGGPPTPLAPPVPSSQTSSGFRRAPSLARRLRRLGLLATVLVVGGVYQQLKGGPDDAPSSRQVTAGAVAQAPLGEPTSGSEHGEPRATREEPKAKAIPQASRVTTVASADRAQPSDRAGASRPGPARAAVRCCEPTQQELAEAAAKGELKIRGPQVSGKSLVVPEGTVAELRLSPDQVARIEKLFADSNRRMHAELLQFNREADTRARETENNFQLFDELRELPKSEFRASVHQLARERAGIIPRQRSDQDPIVLKALDAVLEEDERAITELEALVGAEKARAVMASGKHSRVFSPPRLGR